MSNTLLGFESLSVNCFFFISLKLDDGKRTGDGSCCLSRDPVTLLLGLSVLTLGKPIIRALHGTACKGGFTASFCCGVL